MTLKRFALVLMLTSAIASFGQTATPAKGCTADEAKQLIAALNVEEALDQSIKLVYAGIIDGFKQGFAKEADTDPKVRELMNGTLDQMGKDMMKVISTKELAADMIPMYQRFFTSEDVKIIVAFYQSPTGKKMVSQQQAMMQAGGEIGQQYMTKKQKELDALINQRVEEFKKQLAELKAKENK